MVNELLTKVTKRQPARTVSRDELWVRHQAWMLERRWSLVTYLWPDNTKQVPRWYGRDLRSYGRMMTLRRSSHHHWARYLQWRTLAKCCSRRDFSLQNRWSRVGRYNLGAIDDSRASYTLCNRYPGRAEAQLACFVMSDEDNSELVGN